MNQQLPPSPPAKITISTTDPKGVVTPIDPLLIAESEFKPLVTPNREGTVSEFLRLGSESAKKGGNYLSDEVGKTIRAASIGSTMSKSDKAAIAMGILYRADIIAEAQKKGLSDLPALTSLELADYTQVSTARRFKADPMPDPVSQETIEIRKGDTLSGIVTSERTRQLWDVATKAMDTETRNPDIMGTLISAFAATNKIENIHRIQAGKTLVIPSEEALVAHIKELGKGKKIDAQGNFIQTARDSDVPSAPPPSTPLTPPSQESRGR